MEAMQTNLTDVYTPQLRNSFRLTFARAPDPPDKDFSDSSYHESDSQSIPVGIIDAWTNNENYKKCLEVMKVSKYDNEDFMIPFQVTKSHDLSRSRQKFDQESIEFLKRKQDPLIEHIDRTTMKEIVKWHDEF